MKTWDDWTDEDLANQILVVIHGEVINFFTLSDCKTYVYDCGVIGESFYRVDLIDINNPADMWPIILGNGISLINDKGFYYATSNCYETFEPHGLGVADGYFYSKAENKSKLLRAAAIVFLMMNGVNPE